MKHIVVDASAALALCLNDEEDSRAVSLLESLDKYQIIIPPHWWVEVANGLLMAEKRKRVSMAECYEAMQLLMELEPEIIQVPPACFIEKVMPLSYNYKLTSYDAYYLHLAINKKAPLVTLDKALYQAAGKAGAIVFNK